MDLDEVPEAGPSKSVKTNGATNGDSEEHADWSLFYPAAIEGGLHSTRCPSSKY